MKNIGNWIGVLLLTSYLLLGQTPTQASGNIRYVKPGGINSGTCSTWGTACGLQHAIAVAVSGDQVWVAQGTYVPTTTSDRTASFHLKNFVSILGGFVGSEDSASQRNSTAHVTILSGEIGTSSTSDNSYHVVQAEYTDHTAVLDGFTVTAGEATGTAPNDRGGGLYNLHGSNGPILSDLIFQSNIAVIGAGMANVDGDPGLKNVTFKENNATYGGAIYDTFSIPVVTDVTFDHNSAIDGGALYNYDSSSGLFTNVTFNENTASGNGGAILNDRNSSITLKNGTFSGNSGASGNAFYNILGSSPKVYDSIFWDGGSEFYDGSTTTAIMDSIVQGGCPASGATCTNVINSDPLLGTLGDNGGVTQTMAISTGSPAFDAGDASGTHCASTDQRGVHRPQGKACDMGAYELIVPVTLTLHSSAAQDGWILESGENTNVGGGSPNSTGPTLTLGDNASRRQYRAILSFNTSVLPDNASISSVQLRIKRSSVTPPASNPISLLNGLMVDMKKGFFGTSSSLQASDFQAAGTKTIGPFFPNLSSGFYTLTFPGSSFATINKLSTNGGLTQIRLRFKLDDNNNSIANTLNLISGNNLTPSNRPELIIVYNTP